MNAVSQARREVDRRAQALEQARATLSQTLAQAQDNGATIAQLIEWSGLSRRRVFDLLARARAQ